MKNVVGLIVIVVLLTIFVLTLLERKQQKVLEDNCRSEGGYFVHYFNRLEHGYCYNYQRESVILIK